MKNFAIHNIINAKPFMVALHGFLPREVFLLSHKRHVIKQPVGIEYINRRIAELDLAEKLAREDVNPKNLSDNYVMITKCISGKIELMSVRELLRQAV